MMPTQRENLTPIPHSKGATALVTPYIQLRLKD